MQRQIIQTTSIWHDGFNLPTYSPLTTDLRIAVAVVGAGIAGLSTAYQLAKRGIQVAVFDDGPIGGGDTGNTTAQLTGMLDKGYAETEYLRGTDGTRLTAESHLAAIDMIERIIPRRGNRLRLCPHGWLPLPRPRRRVAHPH
ncbi:FAD-binding oxidoreductase [Candidatus Chloroploca sp. M-50]|uniref:FAD-binding oxidoreductase n=1 Tax=Candidatus Chloroploca mongolica TaxID=2528176 RepID=A0ABS4D4H9_9CHLR|nr:FAD-binding oxidoreductase [Candidatus Chloroploca mongolica]MBP1464344.1 FAD-binding oxidoreductase [Candidatus Chloroploca mongolica]